MYGAKHELTPHRTSNSDAIYKSNDKIGIDKNVTDKVKRGKVNFKKISWRSSNYRIKAKSNCTMTSNISNRVS